MRISGSDCAHSNDASDSPAKTLILIKAPLIVMNHGTSPH
jgi:hypothetical protein